MKKYLSFLTTILLTLVGLVTFLESPASADNRLTLTTSSNVVFFGSGATLTASTNGQIYDYSNYIWASMRFEVIAANETPFDAKADVSQTSVQCAGVSSNIPGFGTGCTTEFSTRRIVLNANASVTSSSSQTINSIRLTQTSGTSQIFRVRGWVDRNSNEVVDPFEPATPAISITTVDPTKARTYLAFQVDPPRFADSKITASMGANVGKGIGIIDPAKVTMKIHACGANGCVRVTGNLTFNSIQQIARYEFSTAVSFRSEGIYVVEMFYAQNATTTLLMHSKSFDYSKRLPNGVKTKIVAPTSVNTALSSPNNERPARTKVTSGAISTAELTYTAVFSDSDASLISNREVYVYLDMKDIKTPSQFLVDGVQVSNVVRDEVILRRFTDSAGQLELKFEYPVSTLLERLEVDLQVNGMRPYEFADPGSEEAFVWDISASRAVSLFSNKSAGSSVDPITLSAVVFTDRQELVTDGAVVFDSDEYLVLETPAGPIDSSGRVSTLVRISNLAPRTGQGYVSAQTISPTGIVTSKVLFSWTDFGKSVNVLAQPISKLFSLLTNISVTDKQATITIYGLTISDYVQICREKACYGATYGASRAFATKTFAHKSIATYYVKVNNVEVFRRKVG